MMTYPMRVEPLETRTLWAATALDPTFGGGDGVVEITVDSNGPNDTGLRRVERQVDGKIILITIAGGKLGLTRLAANGDLDQTFGVGGVAEISTTALHIVNAAIDPTSGRILVI